ncbi:hypothetical protein LVJ82_04065 [Vitreoscilla massiliensis]|uniref:Uncharacterized protein n=1 Tax=Vitreoscilla massiliensis TaxID=1689272 RepID=A0ABY4E340_9NEIS|nr:hypothetical protein [Vitreoscilla massiliensis]UOO90173.1 hypothetical protein LVJ82_04065 [Vitreoscilla massiliensis]
MHTALWGEMELTELAAYVQAQEPTALRATLLQQFHELKSYRNASEWNRLVRVCECLRIIGWGEAEPVEALAQVWLNGAWYTRLQNSAFACVAGGEEQEWRIRHGVQVLAAQPDSDGDCAKLASQRNPLPKSPLRWQCSGNHDRALLP